MINVGDIVEALEDAPYAITTQGTQWVVYTVGLNPNGLPSMQVSRVPDSLSQFKRNLATYFKESYSSRRQRVEDKFHLYTVDVEYFKVVGKMQSNRQLAKELLSKEDMWEQPKKRMKKIRVDGRDIHVIEEYGVYKDLTGKTIAPWIIDTELPDTDSNESDLPW